MTNREQIRAERIAFLKDFFKNSVVGLILIFIAFGLLAAGNVLNGRWTASVDMKMAEANDLASQVAKTRAQIQAIDENQKYAITGVDLDRKAADDQIFHISLPVTAPCPAGRGAPCQRRGGRRCGAPCPGCAPGSGPPACRRCPEPKQGR